MSKILCHGLCAHFLFEQDCTVEGVGGQDTKAIKIEGGKPADFIMNDKCSAGTGKFLEISASRLGLELSEIYKTARKNPAIKLSSTCTVFAETILAKRKQRAIWSQISPSATSKSPVR